MAIMISKVVRSSSANLAGESSSINRASKHTNVNNPTGPWPEVPQSDRVFPLTGMNTNISGGRSDSHLDKDGRGIVKTVTMMVKSDSDIESCGDQVSMKNLTGGFISHNSSNGNVSVLP